MKKIIYISTLALLVSVLACKKDEGLNSSDHKDSFIKAYGTLATGVDIVQTDDGGYFMLGTTQGALANDLLLVKADEYGNTQWSKTYTSSNGADNVATSMELLSNGGVAILATTTGVDTISSTYLLIVDESGFKKSDHLWNSGIVNPVPEVETANGMTVSTEGEEKLYLVSQRVTTSGLIMSIVRRWTVSTSENIELELGYGNVNISVQDIAFHAENDVKITGYGGLGDSSSTGLYYDRIEEDPVNNELKAIGTDFNEGTPQKFDAAYCIISTSDGNYACAGSSQLDANSMEILAFKVQGLETTTPSLEWMFKDATTGLGSSESFCIIEVSDGYVLAGYTENLDRQFHIVKINKTGTAVMWEKNYGFTNFDEARKVIETADNGLAVFGTSSDERGNQVMTLLKLDSKGNLLE